MGNKPLCYSDQLEILTQEYKDLKLELVYQPYPDKALKISGKIEGGRNHPPTSYYKMDITWTKIYGM